MRRRAVLCSIVPPHILRAIAENGDEEDRARALVALSLSAQPRRERQAVTLLAGPLLLPSHAKRRTVYDAGGARVLPGRRVRTEGDTRTRDVGVNEAYDGAGRTWEYFRRVHGRRSLDDHGIRLESTVHFGDAFNNAHWNGRQMIYGDGDGKYFGRFTSAIDVIAHELTHGVTQYTSALGFSGQCGALAEHFSDVFGILVKQYAQKRTAGRADWVIGAGLLTRRVNGDGIRSMKAPGTAYDDRILGRDPQPSHMRRFVKTNSDDRGVHINSGIPNHAFYRVATLLGGHAWSVAGKIWYHVLAHELGPRSRFQQCADATWRVAGELYGAGSEPQRAVLEAWEAVGIDVSVQTLERARPRTKRGARAPFNPPAPAAELPQLG